jgi:citrate lyase synthetase
MSEYGISQIYPIDRYSNDQVDKLLLAEGIRRDANLDYTCGMYDDDMNIIPTGSCFGNTLRCMAVSSASTVRQFLKEGRFDELRDLVPDSTLRYFESPEAAPVVKAIRAMEEARHY